LLHAYYYAHQVFESVLLFLYDNFLTRDTLQYGFTIDETVKYFTKEDQKSTVP